MALQKYMEERNKMVVKANDLIQKSRFSLSVQQQKVVLYLISKIQYGDEDFKEYEFDIQNFCRVCGIDCKNGKNYEDLKAQIKAIADKSIWVTLPDGRETLIRWIERPYINRRSGTITVKLDELMKPYLLQLKGNFTEYELFNILAMKSKYSIRLYELIKSIHYCELEEHCCTYTVDELRKRLDAEQYSIFCNFNQRVLKPAMAEINRYTEKQVSARQITKGRKVTAIKLIIKSKEPLDRMHAICDVEAKLGT